LVNEGGEKKFDISASALEDTGRPGIVGDKSTSGGIAKGQEREKGEHPRRVQDSVSALTQKKEKMKAGQYDRIASRWKGRQGREVRREFPFHHRRK